MSDVLAIHGIECHIPGEWDVAINRGNWKHGYVVLVHRRRPLLNITWDRRPRTPDFKRTLRSLSKRMERGDQAKLEGTETVGDGGLLCRYASPQGRFHAAAFRPDPEQPVTMIVRQLGPGTADDLRQLIAATRICGADEPTPWRLHGLAVELPPAWRLQGIQQFPGLVRGVWFRTTVKAHRHDQVLVLRRFACAGRMLGEQDIASWISDRLTARERLVEQSLLPGPVWRGVCSAPGSNWYKRLRRIRDQRLLHCWIEADNDRLLV
jgi:hypothetical protein